VLAAHEQYYEGRPFLDALVFKIVVGSKLEERFAKFLQGDLAETILPRGKKDEVHTDPRYRPYQHVRIPTLSLLYIGFNTQRKPFDDRRVRQAFNYAVNKEAIVWGSTQRGQRRYPSASLTATGALPPGMLRYDPPLQEYAYDPAKAKRLLADTGYPDGAGFPVVQPWSAVKSETAKAELAAYQRDLAAVGVQVDVHYAPDWPTYTAMLEQGQLPMFRLAWQADIPDPDNVLSPLLHTTGSSNYMRYRNLRVDQLLEQARQAFSEYLYQPYVQGVEVSLLDDRAIPLKKIWLKQRPAASSTAAMTGVQPNP
jgi:oligopeptide transport system substrate-binding protein